MKNFIMAILFIIFAHQKSYSTNVLPILPTKPAATATIFVTAAVPIACTVTATSIAFTQYLYSSPTKNTQNSTLVVTCTNKTPIHIELSAGTGVISGTAATTTTRSMTSVIGSNSLPYKLCQDANCTKNWGMQDTVDTLDKTATGLPETYTVYGVIDPGINAAGGVYADTINVIVSY
ncbi:MAG: Csu type fimbrial protein [Janthinobacterium lividum]